MLDILRHTPTAQAAIADPVRTAANSPGGTNFSLTMEADAFPKPKDEQAVAGDTGLGFILLASTESEATRSTALADNALAQKRTLVDAYPVTKPTLQTAGVIPPPPAGQSVQTDNADVTADQNEQIVTGDFASLKGQALPDDASFAKGQPDTTPQQSQHDETKTDINSTIVKTDRTAGTITIDEAYQVHKTGAQYPVGIPGEATLTQPVDAAADIRAHAPAIMPATAPTAILQPSFAAAQAIGAAPAAIMVASPAAVPDILAQSFASREEGLDRIVVQLDPPELGRIALDFKFDAQGLQTVTITSEVPDALRRLRSMHEQLLHVLEQNGLSSENLTFSEQPFQDQTDHPRASAKADKTTWREIDSIPIAPPITPPATAVRLSSGGFDIKV